MRFIFLFITGSNVCIFDLLGIRVKCDTGVTFAELLFCFLVFASHPDPASPPPHVFLVQGQHELGVSSNSLCLPLYNRPTAGDKLIVLGIFLVNDWYSETTCLLSPLGLILV